MTRRKPIPVDPAAPGPKGWVHTHSATLVDLFRIVDAAWIAAGLWMADRLLQAPWMPAQLIALAFALALFTVASGQWPLYRSWRAAPLSAELRRTAQCWVVAFVPTIALLFLLDPWVQLPRQVALLWAMIALALMLITRIVLRVALHRLRRQGANFRIAAIIGANATGLRLAREIGHSPWMGMRLLGFFDDRTDDADGQRMHPQTPVIGPIDDLLKRVQQGGVDIVYIALPLRAELRIQQVLAQLRDSTVTVHYVPDFSAFGLLHASWDMVAGMPLVSLIDTPHRGTDGASKRVFDIVVSSLLLVLLALPLLAVAVAIRLDSPGPALFRQKRYGLDGREFEIYKFRSMAAPASQGAFQQATRNDPRVTRLGRWLRRTSIDELPQLINVLQGRMSLVGPRPHPVALNESQRKRIHGYMLRHKVRPGITGWAQINGYRGETDTPEKMEGRVQHDLEYINYWSLSLDLRILWLTLFRVMNDPHAY